MKFLPYIVGMVIIFSLITLGVLTQNEPDQDLTELRIAINDGLLQYQSSREDSWITLTDINAISGNDGVGIEDISIDGNGNLWMSLTNQKLVELGNIMGPPGLPGEEGVSIENTSISNQGQLLLTYSDGRTQMVGQVVGPRGEVGRGIKSVSISTDGHLMVEYSDDIVENLGSIVGPQGPTGPTGNAGPRGLQGIPGENGQDGQDGLTPYIGENGNWFIGSTDTGAKASTDLIQISDAEELAAIADCLACDYELTSNIDLTNEVWDPIGDGSNPFTGTLNGNNFTISNPSNSSAPNAFGLFDTIGIGAEISNLVLFIDSVSQYGNSGGVLARSIVGVKGIGKVTELESISLYIGSPVVAGEDFGFISSTIEGTVDIQDVNIFQIETVDLATSSGILFSKIEDTSLVIDGVNYVSSNKLTTDDSFVGIIAGEVGTISNVMINNTNLDADFYVTGSSIGVYFGIIDNALEVSIHDSFIHGDIDAGSSSNFGGIVGSIINSELLLDNVSSKQYELLRFFGGNQNIGGFVGYAESSVVSVRDSYLEIDFIDMSGENMGGYIGTLYDNSSFYAESTDINMQLSGNAENVGGLIGKQGGSTVVVMNSYVMLDAMTGIEDNFGGVVGLSTFQFTSSSVKSEQNNITLRTNRIIIDRPQPKGTMGGMVGRIVSNRLVTNASQEFDESIIDGKSGLFRFYDNEISVIELGASNQARCGGAVGEIVGGNTKLFSNTVDADFIGCGASFNSLLVGLAEDSQISAEYNRVYGTVGGSVTSAGLIASVSNIGYIRLEYNQVTTYMVESGYVSFEIGEFDSGKAYIDKGSNINNND